MKNGFLFIILFALFLSVGCRGTNLFDQLSSTSVNVVLKGTFESNDPRVWDKTIYNDDSMTFVYPDQALQSRSSAPAAAVVDPDVNISGYDVFPTVFNFDVAKMCVNGDDFSVDRMMYFCEVNDTDPFFDGTGVSFSSGDLENGERYTEVELYLRKMMFNSANEYELADDAATYIRTPKVNFDELHIFGYDINQEHVWAFWDNLRDELYDINRIFPLAIPIADGGEAGLPGFVSDTQRKTVIEMRFLIKNFVKRFEIIRYDDVLEAYGSYHIFGLSDWMRDIRPYRTDWLGGNLLTVARVYYPDAVGEISGNVGSSYAGAVVMAIPEEQASDPNSVTLDQFNYAKLYDYDQTAHTISLSNVSGLKGFYEYSNRPVVADYYGTGATDVTPDNYSTQSALSFESMNYYLEYERWKYDYYYRYFGCVMNTDDPTTTSTYTITNNIEGSESEYDDYAAVWDVFNTTCNTLRLPPLASSVKADGTYTLEKVPVGKGYRLYVSTQSLTPASAVPAAPAAPELPYGWKPRSTDTSVSVSAPGATVTADF